MDASFLKKLSIRIASAAGFLAIAGGIALAAQQGGGLVHVSGAVTDGSGHGWPLYARIEVTSASTEPVVVFSDPLTGAYAADLAGATAYTFAVTSVAPGYQAGGGPVTTAGSPLTANWNLLAAPTCDAPGYGPGSFTGPLALNEGFDAGIIPPTWTVDSVSGAATWHVYTLGDPCEQFDGNRTGGSGPYAVINSDCDSDIFNTDDSALVTPAMNLSALGNATIQWANDFNDSGSGSIAQVDASIDGGTTWTNVWQATENVLGPGNQIVDMSFAAGHASVKARFHYTGFWAWWWQVDNVQIGPFACAFLPGGLFVGNVTDANSNVGLNGATVTNLADASSTTTAAGEQGDGFYSLFVAGSGSQSIEASADLHGPVTQNANVVTNGVARLDFALPAGLLHAAPSPLSVTVNPGGTQDLTLTVSNLGTLDGAFVIHEVNVPPQAPALARSAKMTATPASRRAAQRIASGFRLRDPAGLPAAGPSVALTAGAGNVVSSFDTGFLGGWGLAYDTTVNRLWVTNSDAERAGLPGDGFDYQYLPDGTATGETIDMHATASAWQGDGTYNARTGMIWQTNIGFLTGVTGDKCLFEIDPVTRVVTGKQICGPWGEMPQFGLAYDYATDTYYAGDPLGVITHIDSAGNFIDSGSTGVQISGLAYNPTTGHLFIETHTNIPFDMYVADPRHGYTLLSGFNVKSGGVNVLNPNGVSLEADCNGHLWVYDFAVQRVYEVESGETGWCVNEIPWLSEDPTTGTIPSAGPGARLAGGGNTLPVTVTFDSQGLLPGLRQGSLVFTTDTPNAVAPVPVNLTVRFLDVAPNDPPGADPYENYIYGAAGSGVMTGCAPYPPAYGFCPAEVVTRRSMAGFIERGVHGALTPPPVYRAEFGDVLLGSFNADYIQGLLDDGITAGCSLAPPLYCPDAPVTRGQMAVFIWKGQNGQTPPPECTGVFGDVPCPPTEQSPYGNYIQGISDEGVTAGCGNGNFCPDEGIPNEQMAVFLVKAFGIPILP